MSETSEAAAKTPRARKTTTTVKTSSKTSAKTSAKTPAKTVDKTTAKKAPAKTGKSKSAKTAAESAAPEAAPKTAQLAPEAPSVAEQPVAEAAAKPSTKTAGKTPVKTPRKRAAPRAAASKSVPEASAAPEVPVSPVSDVAEEKTPASAAPAAPKAKSAAKSRAPRKSAPSKKAAESSLGAAAPGAAAVNVPSEAAPAPASADEAPQEGGKTDKPGKSTRGRGRSSGSARGKKAARPENAPKEAALAETPEAAAALAGPEMSGAVEESSSAPQAPASEVQADSASSTSPASSDTPEDQPREKSRRSRSRRGRRKSAAARAAAQALQENGAAQPGEAVEAPLGEAEGETEFDEAATDGEEGESAAQAGEKSGKSREKGAKGQGKSAKEPEKARQKRKMFVSVLPGEQVEVVLTAEGQVQEYYVEMLHQVKIKGNIYKGVIHNVDANLQAAFVSYGAAKNGFLQIDEVHPEYYLAPHEASKGHKYPLIQKVLKPGQEILVQVVKEPSGTKGAFLTSYLSLAGRFLVLTPGREQIGVSRKVDSDEERSRLRDLLSGLNPGEGLGVIVRTVSSGATKTSLQKDLQLLKRVWKDVRKKGSSDPAPCLIYQELGLDTRAVRDYLTDEVLEVWVDDEDMAEQIRELVSVLFPRKTGIVQVHKDLEQGLFERFGLKKQLEQVHSREVTLPSGGRLVFDHTEALMAIDINSGRSAGKSNFEDTAFKTNLEAAQQIPLQLRLRDIGGQVVIDFIEMRDRSHWREVEKAVRNGMKNDRARHDIGKISSFGLMEIVRQRLSSSAISTTVEPCPCCKGTGQRRNLEWQAMQVLRDIRARLRKQSAAANKPGNGGNNGNGPSGTLVYSGNPELILYLLNNKRERLAELEKSVGMHLELKPE